MATNVFAEVCVCDRGRLKRYDSIVSNLVLGTFHLGVVPQL